MGSVAVELSAAPDYGRRLIPQILDSVALTDPDRILYSVAKFSNDTHKFQDISAHTFAKAVDKTAWWLHDQIGNPSSIEPVGYIGPHDLRHILLTYACVKAGYTALFLSPKNSIEGAVAVLDAAKCKIWAKPRERPLMLLVENALKQRPLNVLELPELAELLDAESTKPFPYEKSFNEATQDPFCLLHTSGTTGLPKPVSWSNGLIGTMDAVRLLPPTEGDDGLAPWTSEFKEGSTIYSSFPMSHGAGIIMNILLPSLFGLPCILGPVDVPPNIHLVDNLLDHAKIDIWSMVPSLVDELGETPDILAKMKSSKFICASGGPVSPISAAKVNDVIRVLNLTGTTEGLFIGNLVVEREDWHWFAFHPFSGFEFKEVEPGVYEQWIHKNENWSLFQGIFHTFPIQKSINLKDLYIRHPIKSNLYAFKGRSDDIVVLSNGYKISPLATEALITTHPAVNACLMIGTGKPQAGLLIELKDPASKNTDLFESIWSSVERANTVSLHKNQLLRDYIAFAKPEMPFICTDKGTVKRHATLTLYADFIEEFYDSRGDEDLNTILVDTSSLEGITDAVRQILGSLLPAIHKTSPDEDIFSLGLDSLLVVRAVKTIGTSMGLREQLGPRHIYANPTIAKLSNTLARLVVEEERKNGATSKDLVDDETAKLQQKIAAHKARLGFKTNPFDYINPNHYIGLIFFFPLLEGTSFEHAFAQLQAGLRRTFELIPALEGKIMVASEQEEGYKKGDLRVTIPPLSSSIISDPDASKGPRHLIYKDLSQVLPPFKKLRDGGFVPSAFKDELVLPGSAFPELPADILMARANFVEGGCILATNFHHCCLDGVGVMIALRTWAEACRYLQGDKSATCSWLDPESFNHSLPEILYEQEGYAKPAHEVDPGVWGFLPFLPPDNPIAAPLNVTSNTTKEPSPPREKALPPRPIFSPHNIGFPAPIDRKGRCMDTSLFIIPPENVEKLQQEALSDPESKGVKLSLSDIIQAFFWRSAIKSRYRVATELHGQIFGPDEISILELPVDGRPYFSSLLPSSYMGSMLILNRPNMPVERLCSPDTSIASIAYLLREAAARIRPSLFHDAFTLLKTLPNYDRFTTAVMGLDGNHAMISNLILFQTSDISFGDGFFADGGSPKAMRPLIERGNARFRFLVIYPMREDGGVELVLGTLPEELDMLNRDEEFTRYAKHME